MDYSLLANLPDSMGKKRVSSKFSPQAGTGWMQKLPKTTDFYTVTASRVTLKKDVVLKSDVGRHSSGCYSLGRSSSSGSYSLGRSSSSGSSLEMSGSDVRSSSSRLELSASELGKLYYQAKARQRFLSRFPVTDEPSLNTLADEFAGWTS